MGDTSFKPVRLSNARGAPYGPRHPDLFRNVETRRAVSACCAHCTGVGCTIPYRDPAGTHSALIAAVEEQHFCPRCAQKPLWPRFDRFGFGDGFWTDHGSRKLAGLVGHVDVLTNDRLRAERTRRPRIAARRCVAPRSADPRCVAQLAH